MINPPHLEENVPIDLNDNQYLEVIRQASADLAYYYILKIGSRIDNYSTDGLKSYIDAVVDDPVVDTVLQKKQSNRVIKQVTECTQLLTNFHQALLVST